MPNQDELFQLIKTLTPSEKRYFKVNASKSGDAKSNYMQLFEAMDAQGDEYDEQKLKEKHTKKPFVKYLSAEKKQLREQIMKQMRLFHSDNSVDNRINELLEDASIYKLKGLVSLNEKALLKAKGLATKYERYHLLKQVLSRLTGHTVEYERKKLTEPVVKLINEQKQLAILQETELELQTKNRELFSIYRSGADISNETVRDRAEMLITEVERYRVRIGNSFTLGILFARANSNYNQLFRDWNTSFKYTLNEYDLYQKYSHFKTEDAYNYKICVANLMSRAMSTRDNQWFLKATEEMKNLPVPTFNEEGEVFQNVYFSEHLFYINQGDFDKAQALIPKIKEGLDKYAAKINQARKLAFQFNIMIMYFILHDFKEALVWTEPLLNDNSEIKQHQKFVTVLLLPFIHFELGHADLVETFARSAYRLLKSKNRLHSFERLVIKYLQNMPSSVDQEDFKTTVNEFDQQLEELLIDPNVPTILGMEELSLWAKSHSSGKKMNDILKEKALAGQ